MAENQTQDNDENYGEEHYQDQRDPYNQGVENGEEENRYDNGEEDNRYDNREEENRYDNVERNGYQDEQYDNFELDRLPPIDAGRQRKQQPDQSSYGAHSYPGRKPVYDRLYDPNFRERRSLPQRPETVYYRDFKSRPPKNLEHVKSKFKDPSYYEPRGEYVLEEPDPGAVPFKAHPPKELEHVQSRLLNPKKEVPEQPGNERAVATFHAQLPQHLGHVQPRIYDPKYFAEKPQYEEEVVIPQFKARLPKKLGHVQSRILDPKYFQEKPQPEEEKIDTEFRSKPPRKLEHVTSRILEPKKPKPVPSEDGDTSPVPSFRSKPPKYLQHVASRIKDPAYYEPKPARQDDGEEVTHNEFKARLPGHLQHVESRFHDPKYLKKKSSPIPFDEREAQNMNTDFKSKQPKALQHVQSRFFDEYKSTSPRYEPPSIELKQKGNIVVINVKKDTKPKSQGNKDRQERSREVNGYSDSSREIYSDPREYKSKNRQQGRESPRNNDHQLAEKKEVKRWKPPKKPKTEKINKEFFDSWAMTPTHVVTTPVSKGSEDVFYRNRQEVANMWDGFVRSVNKTGVKNAVGSGRHYN
ncbi:uncharacterized protein LOC127875455 isoform X1 [Dreissena polymorpha]|uniref:uncharacterized protein LOC127875455 isoform X1 n=1 Tax=Dreissena polymorpha TaxID=45954 RepID=UPI0022640257|nr:uncharacterized protein LOC127875455 isoform X1 [Dreissena polymorpha]